MITVTPELVAGALGRAGFPTSPDAVALEPREGRWLARLGGGRIAWFVETAAERARLATERRVLRLLEERCRFHAPRVLFAAPDGAFEVRATVAGDVDPFDVFHRATADRDLARQIGADVGAILAEQHAQIRADDVAGWLTTEPSWPLPSAHVRARLPRVTDDVALLARADAVLARYDGLTVPDADRALVHTDVGFHNLAMDPTTFAVRGIFDYAGAAWADRHHDFRYLLFDLDGDEMIDAAVATYEARTGTTIRRDRVALYNAACAISYLADRAGTRPEERPCGRTLAEDLGWTTHAIARALA